MESFAPGFEDQVFYAFHVLNAWEERIEVKAQAGAAPIDHSVVKIISCDMFEFDLEFPIAKEGLSEGELIFKSDYVELGSGGFDGISSGI